MFCSTPKDKNSSKNVDNSTDSGAKRTDRIERYICQNMKYPLVLGKTDTSDTQLLAIQGFNKIVMCGCKKQSLVHDDPFYAIPLLRRYGNNHENNNHENN